MYRVVCIDGEWLAAEMPLEEIWQLHIEDQAEIIDEFLGEGNPVVLVNDLADLERMGINHTNVTIVN